MNFFDQTKDTIYISGDQKPPMNLWHKNEKNEKTGKKLKNVLVINGFDDLDRLGCRKKNIMI